MEAIGNMWDGGRILELLRAFAPLTLRREQMSPEQILRIATHVLRATRSNVLVFGLGADSGFWTALNPFGRTVFVEDDAAWISRVHPSIPRAEIYHVTYATQIEVWADPLDFPANWPEALDDVAWNVILVDGPMGYKPGTPGRQQSIWTAGRLRSPNTAVFVHDYQRPWERKAADAYLGPPLVTIPGPSGTLAEWFVTGG
jgi:hypothetical protein